MSNIHERLTSHADEIKQVHLRNLAKDEGHCQRNLRTYPDFLFDFSRQHVNEKTLELLLELAKEKKLDEKIASMAHGDHINCTENRSVVHMDLRQGEF